MKRSASATWSGALQGGKGNISTQSGVLKDVPYDFNTRFENGMGTNPEELVAAAHAGCFTMALSAQLVETGLPADYLNTSATVTLEKVGEGFAITAVHLDLAGSVPGASQDTFETIANKAKNGCPVSKLLNAAVTLHVRLEST